MNWKEFKEVVEDHDVEDEDEIVKLHWDEKGEEPKGAIVTKHGPAIHERALFEWEEEPIPADYLGPGGPALLFEENSEPGAVPPWTDAGTEGQPPGWSETEYHPALSVPKLGALVRRQRGAYWLIEGAVDCPFRAELRDAQLVSIEYGDTGFHREARCRSDPARVNQFQKAGAIASSVGRARATLEMRLYVPAPSTSARSCAAVAESPASQ